MNDIPGWPWRPDLCPADLHYGEYLLKQNGANASPQPHTPKIIHVGTGLHHHIGLLLGAHGWTVVGLTVSQAEADAYDALTNPPQAYLCIKHDVRYAARFETIGSIADSISLFHLGEPPEPSEEMATEREVIERALTWSREVVFYTGSSAFDRIKPLIADLVAEGKMTPVQIYKTLDAYRPTHD